MSDVTQTLCLLSKLALPYSERSRLTNFFFLRNSKCHLEFKKATIRYEIYLCSESQELFEDLVVKATTYIQHPIKHEQLLGGQEVTLTGNKSKLWVDSVNMFMQKFPIYSETDELKIVIILSGIPVTLGASTDGASSTQVLNLQDREKDDVQQLVDALSSLLTDTERADVQLECSDGQTLWAHSWMLALRSPYFDTNLKRHQGRQGTIKLKVDLDAATMRLVLRYIYVSETPALNCESACALSVAGERFSLAGLQRKCWDWFSFNLNEENFIACLEAAQRYKCNTFKNAVISYISHHREVLNGDLWKNWIDPNNLAIEVLQNIVTSPSRQRSP